MKNGMDTIGKTTWSLYDYYARATYTTESVAFIDVWQLPSSYTESTWEPAPPVDPINKNINRNWLKYKKTYADWSSQN